MNNSKIIAFCLLTITLGCKDKSPRINPELIKYDWISKGDNKYFLMIQDSLMIESLTRGDFPISPYTLSNDTLIIYSQDFDYEKSSPSKERVWKLKIEKVDSVELLLRPAYPNVKDTLFFKKIDQTKQNDLKIERLEFSYTGGYGYSKDILIENDSSLFHYGYSGLSKIEGLSSCKLPPDIYERLQRWIYAIDRDSFAISYPVPVTSIYYLFIKTKNDSIEREGYPSKETDSKLEYLFRFLMFLDYMVNLDSVQNDTIEFRYNRNSDWFKKTNR